MSISVNISVHNSNHLVIVWSIIPSFLQNFLELCCGLGLSSVPYCFSNTQIRTVWNPVHYCPGSVSCFPSKIWFQCTSRVLWIILMLKNKAVPNQTLFRTSSMMNGNLPVFFGTYDSINVDNSPRPLLTLLHISLKVASTCYCTFHQPFFSHIVDDWTQEVWTLVHHSKAPVFIDLCSNHCEFLHILASFSCFLSR